MIHFSFVASGIFELDSLKSVDKFVDLYSDFQSVALENEEELSLLLQLMGIEGIDGKELDNSDFSKYWDLSNYKFPEFNKEQFDDFYESWIASSGRDNNMDEYGSLICLHSLFEKWNKLDYRIIVKEEN